MWVSSAPLRVSLAGGGTDLPTYARRFGGAVLGSATNMRVTVVGDAPDAGQEGVTTCFDPNAFTREALTRHWDETPLRLRSLADVPDGTGLGSSAAFTVALVGGLRGGSAEPAELAEEAARIEIEGLGRSVGRQDHYLAALGGFRLLRFGVDGAGRDTVEVEPVELAPGTMQRLDRELVLYATGGARDAGRMLAGQAQRTSDGDRETLGRLHQIKELTGVVAQALARGAAEALGPLLAAQWELKRGLGAQVSTPRIDRAYATALCAGATGGRLVGAGGAGYLLLHVPPPVATPVREALGALGATEQPFRFSRTGWRWSVGGVG